MNSLKKLLREVRTLDVIHKDTISTLEIFRIFLLEILIESYQNLKTYGWKKPIIWIVFKP